MDPLSRGKRMLEMSKQKTANEAKKRKNNNSPARTQAHEEVSSVLNISMSQLIDLPQDFSVDNVSFSAEDHNLSDLLPVSSALKVANYIMHQCPDNRIIQAATDSNGIVHVDGNVDTFGNVKRPSIERQDLVPDCRDDVEDRQEQSGNDQIEEPHREGEQLVTDKDKTEDRQEQSGNNQIEEPHREGEQLVTDKDETEDRQEQSGNDQIEEPHREEQLVTDKDETEDRQEQSGNDQTEEPHREGELLVTDKDETEDRQEQAKPNKKLVNKQRRMHGKAYIGRQFDKDNKKYVEVEKEEKSLGQRCSCKASHYNCKDVSESARQKIHNEIWRMTWDEKKVFVRLSVDVTDVKERKGVTEKAKRNNTLFFYLKSNGERKRVCKNMFLATTGLKKWWVLNTVTGDEASTSKPNDKQDRVGISEGVNFIKDFLGRLPTMPSHYCRKDTQKVYLEPNFQSYEDIYREYTSVCEAEGKTKMCMTIFKCELKAKNIAIFKPRKDQCDQCYEFKQGNVDEGVYISHRERKAAAQTEKSNDKMLIQQQHHSRTKVVCVDVQRVLLAPSLKASALYYKTKLQIHNYTIFDMASKDVECFLWNEAEGGLNASEFASCLVSYLEEHSDSFDKVIVYSDGCTYQNRNRVLATALRYFCVKHGKTVEQKILERGHTQMEVDSVHATIERRLKNIDIYSPLDYVNLIKASRINPRPYKVKYLTFDFFKDYDKHPGVLKSIKPSKEANTTDMCALRYNPDGSPLAFKLNFADDWQVFQLGRRDALPLTDPQRLHNSKRKIKKSKYDHLQSLKTVLPADVHHFYDALPHL